MAKKSAAVSYLRVSGRGQIEADGFERQREAITRFAASARVEIVDQYRDEGVSGAEFATRPGFVRLMNALKPRPPFQVLVMSKQWQLGREVIETAYALKQIVTAGVRVFFYLEDRERTLDSPADKIMLSLTDLADELEHEKARQRTYDAMLWKARTGTGYWSPVLACDNAREAGVTRMHGSARKACCAQGGDGPRSASTARPKRSDAWRTRGRNRT